MNEKDLEEKAEQFEAALEGLMSTMEELRKDRDRLKKLAERPRGRWVDGIYIQNKRTKDVKEARECSECGARYLRFYDVGDGFDCVPPNYCPNCGARMDAEGEA